MPSCPRATESHEQAGVGIGFTRPTPGVRLTASPSGLDGRHRAISRATRRTAASRRNSLSMLSRSRTLLILCSVHSGKHANRIAERTSNMSLDRTWRWRVSHDDMVEIVEALEPAVADSSPQLRRGRYSVFGSDDYVHLDGELRTAVVLAGDPHSITVTYKDVGPAFALEVLTIRLVVDKDDSHTQVALEISGPGTELTAKGIESARDQVDGELEGRGWKIGDAEVVKPVREKTPSPSASSASHPEREGARLSTSEAAEYLGLSRQRILQLIRRGTLPSKTVGAQRTVSASDIEQYRVTRDAKSKDSAAAPVVTAPPASTPVPPASTPVPPASTPVPPASTPVPPVATQHGSDVDAPPKAPGRWRRFWDGKLGQFVTNHVLGTFLFGAAGAVVATIVVTLVLHLGGTNTPPPAHPRLRFRPRLRRCNQHPLRR